MLDNLDLEAPATAHARELNKSIEKIALNLLLGLVFIGSVIFLKRR